MPPHGHMEETFPFVEFQKMGNPSEYSRLLFFFFTNHDKINKCTQAQTQGLAYSPGVAEGKFLG